MRRRIPRQLAIAAVLICSAAATLNKAGGSGVADATPAPVRVLQIGDSLTAFSSWTAMPQYTKAGYSPMIEGRPSTALGTVNSGGFRWLPRYRALLADTHPAVIVVELGTNDAARGTDPAVFATAVEQVLALSGTTPLYWPNVVTCSVWPNLAPYGRQLNVILANAAAQHPSLHVIDMNTAMCARRDLMKPDTVHYVTAGEQLYADVIVKAVTAGRSAAQR